MADEQLRIYAYDISTGGRDWVYVQDVKAGKFLTPPVVDADSNLYSIAEDGWLTAIDANGDKLWDRLEDADNQKFEYSPIIGPGGRIFVVEAKGNLYAYNLDGSDIYHYNTGESIKATATLGEDGSLYFGTDGGNVYAINPDGTLRFSTSTHGKFITSPALSLDGTQVFLNLNERKVMAFDTVEGYLNWEYSTEGDLKAGPAVATNGNIHIGDDKGHYYILNPYGMRVFHYTGFR